VRYCDVRGPVILMHSQRGGTPRAEPGVGPSVDLTDPQAVVLLEVLTRSLPEPRRRARGLGPARGDRLRALRRLTQIETQPEDVDEAQLIEEISRRT
jgi:hypothetical protein